MLDRNLLKPTASGFGQYVYCGGKLFIDNNPARDSERKRMRHEYEISQKGQSLKIGIKNEHKCIEWIMTRYKTGSVLFDGTGRDNHQLFKANIHSCRTIFQCRPDLIIKHEDQTILYEFKCVGKKGYLRNPEFDSYHAQVWCYRFIDEFKIDKYYLLRYFEDPFMFGAFPSITELSDTELSNDKFEPLAKQYIDAINTINGIKLAPMRSYSNKILSKFNMPKNKLERSKKCNNCMYLSECTRGINIVI